MAEKFNYNLTKSYFQMLFKDSVADGSVDKNNQKSYTYSRR